VRSFHPCADGARTVRIYARVMNKTVLVRFLSFQRTVVLNVLAPVAVYQVASSRGVAELQALLLAAIFPIANIAWTLARQRRIDPIGGISLVAIAGGVGLGVLFNDPRLLLVKDSLVTALLGIACLASLLGSRPLLVVFAAHSGVDRQRLSQPRVQAAIRRMTVIWGVAFLVEASLRLALSFVVEPAVLMTASPMLAAVVFGPLGLWTMRQSRRPMPAPASA